MNSNSLKSRLAFVLLGLTFALSGCGSTRPAPASAKSASPPPASSRHARLPLSSCKIEGLEGEALCGSYPVWENRDTRTGRKISLKVVVLPATEANVAPDPVFFFAGGPGDGSASHAADTGREYADLRRHRDLVMVDQRGTGGSNLLQCPVPGSEQDLQGYFEPMLQPEAVRKCREELEKKADLKLYTTSIAMDDIDEVRAWLGYDKINLEGGSYGTRAAQVYMRRHPEHVRSAALFGVAGMTQYLPLYHAPAGKRSLDLVVAACLADTACQKAFPNLASELAEVVARLGREPANARISLEKGKPEVAIRIERGVFAEELRFMLYQPGLTPLVPLVIHQAYQGDWRPFVRLSLVWEPLLRGILAIGMHLSVTCAEDVPYFDRVNVQEILAGTYLGDYRSKQQIEACREWVRGEIPADFHQPVSVRVPTLLVSGNFDPVTPPQWAEEAARHLPLSLQVLVPEGGHSLGGLTNPECIENLEQKFFEQGSVDGLDTSCVKTMKRRPFATDPAAIDEVLAALGG